MNIDVLCVGHASYDLIFSVNHHPQADEKTSATDFLSSGGGPAANAAVCIARLGFNAAFSGYLGADIFGENHHKELLAEKVNTDLIVRGQNPTPLSSIIVKPNGHRSLINYKGSTTALPADAINFSDVNAKALLFDGHEPHISLTLLKQLSKKNIPTVLDAGSVHEGTLSLMDKVDYLVCSEKFALQFVGDINNALKRLTEFAPHVVITLGDKGLIWKTSESSGSLPAFPIQATDSTGAGDAFHGAFTAALTTNLHWLDILKYASAAGALCCTKMGARNGLPSKTTHQSFLS